MGMTRTPRRLFPLARRPRSTPPGRPASAEIRRGLQALSSLYVERRGRIAAGAALEGAGKRAAFALYLGPLHFLIVRGGGACPARRRTRACPDRGPGCGTAAAGAAWALESWPTPFYEGVDRSGWAAGEARFTLRTLGLRGRAQAGELDRVTFPVAARGRRGLHRQRAGRGGARTTAGRAPRAGRAGARVLVVEPISGRIAPWWRDWAAAFASAGGRADQWRFPAALPETLAALDRAAGLDHRELLARSLWLGPHPAGVTSPPG